MFGRKASPSPEKPELAPPPSAAELGLDGFRQPAAADDGLSLDKLNRAFAAMLGGGDDPFTAPADAETDTVLAAANEAQPDSGAAATATDAAVEISPRSIVEAMLMVGLPDNAPLTAAQLAGLMRGVRPPEIEELIADLNAQYGRENRPYHIASRGPGFTMTLREELSEVRDRFAGRTKQAKLSPAAIDVLAIVAYNEPISAQGVVQFRGGACSAILAQLVRRDLLRVERDPQDAKTTVYRTTPKLLGMFGVASVAELPRSLELDRQ